MSEIQSKVTAGDIMPGAVTNQALGWQAVDSRVLAPQSVQLQHLEPRLRALLEELLEKQERGDL